MASNGHFMRLWTICPASEKQPSKLDNEAFARRMWNFVRYAEIGDELVFFTDDKTARGCGFCISGTVLGDAVKLKDGTSYLSPPVMSVKYVEDDDKQRVILEVRSADMDTAFYVYGCEGWDLLKKGGFRRRPASV